MKKIDPKRFQKKEPEEISFEPASLNQSPALKKEPVKKKKETTKIQINEGINNRLNETKNEQINERSIYCIEIPKNRRKIRSSFDIFEDQKSGLEKIQLATADSGQKKPKLGNMVQKALDLYIKSRTKELENVQINKEINERTNI